MYLRRLKLTNFRSCASTEVPFDETVTVLAGENNAGKSNVIDALRLLTAPSDARRTRFVGAEDVRLGATDLKLAIEFAGLDPAQCGIFFSALSSNGATDASWQYAWAPPAGTARRRSATWTVGPREHPETEPDIRDFVRHVHLPALRDADRDLASSSPGRIEFLLRQLLLGDEQKREALLGSARTASAAVLGQPPLIEAQKRVRDAFAPLTEGFHPHEAHLRFADPTLVGLARDLRFAIAQEGIDPAKLGQTGLGYSNLLYLASVLVELEAAKDAELTLLLVEEPEAHLHPQLQRAVLGLLEQRAKDSARPSTPGTHAGRIQVIVTTHSPNLTAATSVRRIVVLRAAHPTKPPAVAPTGSVAADASSPSDSPESSGTNEGGEPATKPNVSAPGVVLPVSPATAPPLQPSAPVLPTAATSGETVAVAIAELGLDVDAQRKIDRYLDVTKASLLFGQRVLLVEGIAEALLMPAFAACVLSKAEIARFRSAALLAIDGVDFEPYVRLLLTGAGQPVTRLAEKVVVLTDEDPSEPSTAEPPEPDGSGGAAASAVAAPPVAPIAKPAAGRARADELLALAKELGAADRLHVAITPRTLEASLVSDAQTGAAACDVLKEAFAACVGARGRDGREREWKSRIADLPLATRGEALIDWMTSTKTRKGDFAQILAGLIDRDAEANKLFAVPPHIASALRALVATS
ncbi:ATP-dependent nuclease [Sandaracinus amylolyticus]|uniref:ATP-dependent nuclease n=1 Tax=Sandaracinus amylolyticus TaxID=927083 RepID=UPI001F2989E0|nr:AAA family ATPase [Sandaracinus amylolyticus]UJR83828.1 Hypothetical protein I5071_58990 [Sandaracinus amylolyticus]